MNESKRRYAFTLDMIKEKRISKKTDEILNRAGLKPERTEDMESQQAGCDFILQFKNRTLIVDEKMNSRYWDRPMESYAIELENNGHKVGGNTGWFYNENAKTTHYLFVWIRATDSSLTHITKWEGMFVCKNRLEKLFEMMGCDKDRFHQKVAENGTMTSVGSKYVDLWRAVPEDTSERVCLYQCVQNEESNVNIRLPKSWIKNLSIARIVWNEKNGKVENYDMHPYFSSEMKKACQLIKDNVPPIKSNFRRQLAS